MSYGLEIRNSEGKLLVDGERRMPKLLVHDRVFLSNQTHDTTVGYVYYYDLDFPPTKNPVFITQAIDEEADYNGMRWLRTPYVFRNSNGEFYRTRLEALGTLHGEGQIWVYVWVYEI